MDDAGVTPIAPHPAMVAEPIVTESVQYGHHQAWDRCPLLLSVQLRLLGPAARSFRISPKGLSISMP